VFGSYSQAFNRAYERTGTLFEGPYKALAVDTDAYFVNLCSYIHLNPVHHGLVNTPGAWPYSNTLEWIDKRPGTLVDRELVRATFASPQAYEACVRGLQQRSTFQEGESFLEGRGILHEDGLWCFAFRVRRAQRLSHPPRLRLPGARAHPRTVTQ
jgi:hypothetical protein